MNIRIIITDSGLGGLNILSNTYNYFQKNKLYSDIDLIYFNAVPNDNYGYNQLPTLKEKVNTFEKALLSMKNNFQPDIILIACNTLSVINSYLKTNQFNSIKIKGILETGVNLIYQKYKSEQDSNIIILGTLTTIKSNKHKEGLMKLGIPEDKIFTRSCYLLESIIQEEPISEKVYDRISECLDNLLKEIDNSKKSFIALCCTHYEFSLDLFDKYLSKQNIKYELLNPNDFMVSDTFPVKAKTEIEAPTNIKIKVVSKTKISDNEIASLNEVIEKKCKPAAEALKNYEHIPELF